MGRLALLLSMLLMPLASLSQATAHYAKSGKLTLPDPRATPGAADASIVADLSKRPHTVGGVETNICAPDFKTDPIRASIKNFAGLKKKACAEYGVAKCDASVEGDHLISLEIGGCKDCLANLWPQPMDEARDKDHQVEDTLGGPRGLVCAGKISLKAAQKCVATDWAACSVRIKRLQGD